MSAGEAILNTSRLNHHRLRTLGGSPGISSLVLFSRFGSASTRVFPGAWSAPSAFSRSASFPPRNASFLRPRRTARGGARAPSLLAPSATTEILVIDGFGLAKLGAENRHHLLEIVDLLRITVKSITHSRSKPITSRSEAPRGVHITHTVTQCGPGSQVQDGGGVRVAGSDDPPECAPSVHRGERGIAPLLCRTVFGIDRASAERRSAEAASVATVMNAERRK